MLNQIVLMGRIVADPELKHTASGVSTCTVRLAVERNWRQGDEKQTDFFDVVTWRNNAEFVTRYMSKGQLVAVQGSMQSRKWQDKNGNNRVSWEVQADNVYFTGSVKETAQDSEDEEYGSIYPDMDKLPY